MTVVSSVLMCHAPIVVPAIGRERAPECATTTGAMAEVARRVVAAAPDVVCVVSPHAPRRAGSVGVALGERLSGSFARFGHGELSLTFCGAPALARALTSILASTQRAHHTLPEHELDHGALVPLWFVHEAGYRGPVLLVGLPMPDEASERALGEAIASAAERTGLRVCVIASGDMSHRLEPGAPSGHHPRAAEFDRAFVAALGAGDLAEALSVDPALRALAAEDVVASTRVALAASYGKRLGVHGRGVRVLAYEGPFGVGYCEAVLCDPPASAHAADARRLLGIAREAVRAAAHGEDYAPPSASDPPRAVFVTLRSPSGELRGCIGRTSPAFDHASEEVADCAALAATRDPRMEPIAPAELADLHIDVTLLDPPEWDVPKSDLDPRRYGVVVKSGARQGVLLPDLEGVDSVDEQLAIALRKAAIGAREPHRIARFTVQKFSE